MTSQSSTALGLSGPLADMQIGSFDGFAWKALDGGRQHDFYDNAEDQFWNADPFVSRTSRDVISKGGFNRAFGEEGMTHIIDTISRNNTMRQGSFKEGYSMKHTRTSGTCMATDGGNKIHTDPAYAGPGGHCKCKNDGSVYLVAAEDPSSKYIPNVFGTDVDRTTCSGGLMYSSV